MKDALPEIDPTGWIESGGLKMPKDGQFVKGRVRGRIKRSVYDQAMTTAAVAATRAGDRVLELGCGLGFVTAQMARAHELDAIRAYDGHAGVLAYAEAMLATNGVPDVELVHGVLGPRKGKRIFHVRDPFMRSSLSDEADKTRYSETVPAENAKTVFHAFQPTALICDIEGAEVDLVKCAPLDGLDRAIVRLHPTRLGGQCVITIFQAFADAGLSYWPAVSAGPIVGFHKAPARA